MYVCYRPLSLAFFSWFGLSEESAFLMSIRSAAPSGFPDWCRFALPDGLWAAAYVICIGAVWRFEYPACIPPAMIIPAIGILSEILQAIRLLPGTFDWIDLVMYGAGAVCGWGYIYFVNQQIHKNYKH